jgi:hypothetical protein
MEAILAIFLPPKKSFDASKWIWKVMDPKYSNWDLPLKWTLQANSSNFSTKKVTI